MRISTRTAIVRMTVPPADGEHLQNGGHLPLGVTAWIPLCPVPGQHGRQPFAPLGIRQLLVAHGIDHVIQ